MNYKLSELLGPPDQPAAQTSVDRAGKVALLAEEAFSDPAPRFFEWFEKCAPAQAIARSWSRAWWREEAWAFLQLRYDQIFKDGIRLGRRHGLGGPLIDLSIVATEMNHIAAARHYAALALIADLFSSCEDGLAGTFLANFTSRNDSNTLRRKARKLIKEQAWPTDVPLYPEAVLAGVWLGGKREPVLELARPVRGQTFVERILDDLESPTTDKTSTRIGTLFEAAAGLVLSSTSGFEVRGAVEDSAAQTDLLVSYTPDFFVNGRLPEGYALVECKYTSKDPGSALIRELGGRCIVLGVKLGILVTRRGITGDSNALEPFGYAELERRRFLPHGIRILVISADDLRGSVRDLRGLEGKLRDDFERLCFGEPPKTPLDASVEEP